MKFERKIEKLVDENDSLLCIGLDIIKNKLPNGVKPTEFNKRIIDSTKDLVCCYKINLAFYRAMGEEGMDLLMETMEHLQGIPAILDMKANDVHHSAEMYAREVFEVLGGDAVTVNPYLGRDCIEPFTKYGDKYIFILCRTSNPSAGELQDLKVGERKEPLYMFVARKIREWGENCGAVAGATYPKELGAIREALGEDRFILVPGVGTQGGDLEKAVKFGTNEHGRKAIISVSRSIIYASSGNDFDVCARKVAKEIRDQINGYR